MALCRKSTNTRCAFSTRRRIGSGSAPSVLKEECRLEKTKFREQKLELRARFRYFDKGIMAIVGKNAAVVLSGKLKLTGFIAWLAWLFIHILFLVGFRNKLSVLLGWAFAYVRDTPDTRIIVHRPD